MILLPQRLTARCVALGGAIGLIACTPVRRHHQPARAQRRERECRIHQNLLRQLAVPTGTSAWRTRLRLATSSCTALRGWSAFNFPALAPALPSGRHLPCRIHPVHAGRWRENGRARRDGRKLLIGNPRQSFARFTVVPGEVVNLGELNLVPTDHLANSARFRSRTSTRHHGPAAKAVPKLSSTMVTRWPPTSPGDAYKLTWAKVGLG